MLCDLHVNSIGYISILVIRLFWDKFPNYYEKFLSAFLLILVWFNEFHIALSLWIECMVIEMNCDLQKKKSIMTNYLEVLRN